MVRFGIVGLPNVGKSTLFNVLVQRAQANVSNYPFCTVEPNVSVVAVPDARLQRLQDVFQQEKLVPAAIEVYDIAGLVKGAHEGHGLGNKFLSHIRQVDALLHVVRGFAGTDITHVEGAPDPLRDLEILRTELLLADLDTVDRRIERTAEKAKSGDPGVLRELGWARELRSHLDSGGTARDWLRESPAAESEARGELLYGLFLLTAKPVLYIVNTGEAGAAAPEEELALAKAAVEAIHELDPGAPVVAVAAQLELELTELAADDAALFREELGLGTGALAQVIRTAYTMMDLVTFYTGVGRELRAWPVRRGTTAVEAAGNIHSDIADGFVRAEVLGCDDLVSLGTWSSAREKGRLAVEGRDYVVRDGDVMHFRFTP